jgi:hypothetical protein
MSGSRDNVNYVANIGISITLLVIADTAYTVLSTSGQSAVSWKLLGLAIIALPLMTMLATRFPAKGNIAIASLAGSLCWIAVSYIADTYYRDVSESIALQDPGLSSMPVPSAARPADSPTVIARLNYMAQSTVTALLSNDPASVRKTDGAEILGYSFIPTNPDATVRVTLSITGVVDADNILVAAVFLNDSAVAAHMISVPAQALQQAFINTEFDMSSEGRGRLSVQVRIGLVKAGILRFNTVQEQYPFLLMREIGALQAGHRPPMFDFGRDTGDVNYAALAGIHSPTAEPEIAPNRETLDCGRYFLSPDSLIVMTFGQSMGSNEAETRYQPARDVVNFSFFDGKCYRAADPLIGAANFKGSIWGIMADRLVESGRYKSVVLVPTSYGGTSLKDWMPGGAMSRRLVFAIDRVRRAGGRIDAMLWQQGEAESGGAGYTAAQYVQGFGEIRNMVREIGVAAPIYVAQSTICGAGDRNREEIRSAQLELPRLYQDVRRGPDTDVVPIADRYDSCHYGTRGQFRAGELWSAALLQAQPGGR